MSVDKEPFAVLGVLTLVFLPSLVSIFFFLLRWLLSANVIWEFIVSLILVIVAGILLLSLIPITVYALKESIIEIKYFLEVRKEEKEMKVKSMESVEK
ncbi:MAG: hypothetical protein ACFFDW_04950 [Candidatus Thorarchaeota archaeon]